MSQVKIIFIFFILINACNYNFQDNSVDKIEIQTSWNNTDEYPSTTDCDKFTEKKLRINCFNSYLSDLFTQNLLSEIKSVNSDINDTILIELTINKEGVIIFDKIFMSEDSSKRSPYVRSISLDRFSILLTWCSTTEFLLTIP